MGEVAPRSRPAFQVAPDLIDPTRTVAVWFTDPPGAVIQFVKRERGTIDLAEWLRRSVRNRLLAQFPGNGPLTFVLDLGLMDGRDPLARPVLHDVARSLKARIGDALVVTPVEASPMQLAAIHSGIALLRVFGVMVAIKSLPDALDRLHPRSNKYSSLVG